MQRMVSSGGAVAVPTHRHSRSAFAHTREETLVSISDCSQATARVDNVIGAGNWC